MNANEESWSSNFQQETHFGDACTGDVQFRSNVTSAFVMEDGSICQIAIVSTETSSIVNANRRKVISCGDDGLPKGLYWQGWTCGTDETCQNCAPGSLQFEDMSTYSDPPICMVQSVYSPNVKSHYEETGDLEEALTLYGHENSTISLNVDTSDHADRISYAEWTYNNTCGKPTPAPILTPSPTTSTPTFAPVTSAPVSSPDSDDSDDTEQSDAINGATAAGTTVASLLVALLL